MIKFGLDDYTTDLNDWAKHHKQVALHVKREYLNGKESAVVEHDKALIKLIENNEDKLTKKRVLLHDRKTFESLEAFDYFLPLNNLEYQERDFNEYSIGATNTTQETFVRLFFKTEDVDFILDYSYKSEGTFAMKFVDLIDGASSIKDILDDVAEDESIEVKDKGIMIDPEDKDQYKIVGIDAQKDTIEFEIPRRELVDALIGVEIYKHDMQIN